MTDKAEGASSDWEQLSQLSFERNELMMPACSILTIFGPNGQKKKKKNKDGGSFQMELDQ